jgi:hypothetical protein
MSDVGERMNRREQKRRREMKRWKDGKIKMVRWSE